MQQIWSKYVIIGVVLKFYGNLISALVFSCKFAVDFQNVASV